MTLTDRQNTDNPIQNDSGGNNKYLGVLLDITRRCNLRCRHCFFYRDKRSNAQEIPIADFMERIADLKRRYGFIAALWEGGEPMLRKDLLIQGVKEFEINIIPTNGTIEIPPLPKSIITVSLDGHEPINDYIRGKGSYRRALQNTAHAVKNTNNSIHFQCTVCKINQDHLEELIKDLLRQDIAKLLLNFFVPEKNEKGNEMAWDSNEERDHAVEQAMKLKQRYPDLILNTEEELQRLLSDSCGEYTRKCFLKKNILPLHANLEDRMFCCYGENPDCHRCGSWGVFHYTSIEDINKAQSRFLKL